MKRKDTLDAAAACVLTDRQRTHGPIENSFGLIASLWSAYLSVTVTPFDVAEMMTLLKIARGKGNPLNPDNQVDGAGYQACAAELAESMSAPATQTVHADLSGVDQRLISMPVYSPFDKLCKAFAADSDASTPSDAPAAPQTPPEGDHSQTDAGAQGDAIPDDCDDCDDMWHNPENYPLFDDEKEEGWRFLTKEETELPEDAKFKYTPNGAMHKGYAESRNRENSVTYFTRAPLPQSPAKALDAAISAIQETCTAPAATDYSVTVSGDPERDRMEREIRARNLPTKEEKSSFAKAVGGQEKSPALEPQWHNPENVMLRGVEIADGWRFLTKNEVELPGDAEFFTGNLWESERMWMPTLHHDTVMHINPSSTYRTRAPLPPAAFNALADAVDVIQASRATAPEPQWHNPEGLTLTDDDKATRWRFLTAGETDIPRDAEVTDHRGRWIESRFRGGNRGHKVTYRTRTPLPGAPAPEAHGDHNLHQTTP